MATKSKVSVGDKFRSTYADGNPLWEVKRVRGAYCDCEIVNEPWTDKRTGRSYDSDFVGTSKAFYVREVLRSRVMEASFAKMANSHQAFINGLTPGQVVHYNDGFQNYVRCEAVVCEPGKGRSPESTRQLKPIAMVGNWRKHDLPRRNAYGTIDEGHFAQMIRTGDTFEPNYGNIFESTSYSRKAGEVDPATLKPLDLSVPEHTSEEAALARKINAVQEIFVTIENWHRDYPKKDSPEALLAQLRDMASAGLAS